MKWNGETETQRNQRQAKGVRCIAVLPTQMHDGTWVWLEKYWAGLWFGPNNNRWWVRSLVRDDCVRKVIDRPPPPEGTVVRVRR